MDLEIIKVKNGNSPMDEQVWLKVLKDTNLKYYLIGDNSYNEDGDLSNKHPHVYKFPDKAIKKDDRIVLYSGVGKNFEGKTKLGYKAHYLYWGLKTCVWNNNGKDMAHLMQIIATENVKAPVN